MIKIALASATLLAGSIALTTAGHALEQGVQGRPHAGQTAERMLLYRSHLTRGQYNRMRMHDRRMHRR